MSALVAKELQEQNRILEQLVGNYILDKFYPIGSIYTSTNNVNPSAIMGGTWEQLKDRFLLGAGDTYEAGATGGSDAHSHTHDLWADIYMFGEGTEHNLPPNNAIMMMKSKSHKTQSPFDYYLTDTDANGNHLLKRTTPTQNNPWYDKGTNVGGTIGETNALPPYLAVYMWKRVG